MALKVKWTDIALEDYRKVIDYLLEDWSITVAEEFIQNTESRIETLTFFPNLGLSSDKMKNIKSIVLTKHNKLYYRISDETITILNIFDTRQNPTKNKFE